MPHAGLPGAIQPLVVNISESTVRGERASRPRPLLRMPGQSAGPARLHAAPAARRSRPNSHAKTSEGPGGGSRAFLHAPCRAEEGRRHDRPRSGGAAELLDRQRHAGGHRREGLLGQLHAASVSLPVSATAFSTSARQVGLQVHRFLERLHPGQRLQGGHRLVDLRLRGGGDLLPSSCTPAAQIWPDFINASTLPWPNATRSSAVLIAFPCCCFLLLGFRSIAGASGRRGSPSGCSSVRSCAASRPPARGTVPGLAALVRHSALHSIA